MRFLTNWRKKHEPEPLPEISEFFTALFEGDTEFIRRSLEQGANPNEIGPIGRTALFEAILHEHTEIACLLLSHGAYPDGGSEIAATPLSQAVGNQDIVAIQALLDHGADVNYGVDANGSVLHKAVMSGNVQIVQLLLDRQINLDLKDEEGETALENTRTYWDHMHPQTRGEIVRLLEGAGTNEMIE
jgi:ankyrin repeat protein